MEIIKRERINLMDIISIGKKIALEAESSNIEPMAAFVNPHLFCEMIDELGIRVNPGKGVTSVRIDAKYGPLTIYPSQDVKKKSKIMFSVTIGVSE